MELCIGAKRRGVGDDFKRLEGEVSAMQTGAGRDSELCVQSSEEITKAEDFFLH